MPPEQRGLVWVPNMAIAKSFSHGGVKSMKVEPSAISGVARAVKNAPISSATDRTTAAAATPASAAGRWVRNASRVEDRASAACWASSYRGFVAVRPPRIVPRGTCPSPRAQEWTCWHYVLCPGQEARGPARVAGRGQGACPAADTASGACRCAIVPREL